MLGDDPGQRYGQVVPQRQIGLTRRLVLASLEDLEDELGSLLAVLPEQRLMFSTAGVSSGSNPYRSYTSRTTPIT